MVRTLNIGTASLLSLIDFAKAELQFTPTVDEYVLDGVKLK